MTRPTPPEKNVHYVEDLAHGLGVLDRVPVFEGVVVAPVEAMVAGDDLADFLPRQQVLIANPGAIVQERNRIFFPIGFEREELVHHAVGQKDTVVGRVVVAVSDALHHADDLEADVIQQDRVAYGGAASGKQVLQHFVADDADEALLRVVASFSQRPAARGR